MNYRVSFLWGPLLNNHVHIQGLRHVRAITLGSAENDNPITHKIRSRCGAMYLPWYM